MRFTDEWQDGYHGWTDMPLLTVGFSSRLTAKWPKILPHLWFSDYTYSLWMDGSLQLNRNPYEYIQELLGDNDIALYHHHTRSTVLDEALGLAATGYDDPYTLHSQALKYTMDGFPDTGLYCGTVILRRHTPAIARFNELWMTEILRGSIRDQVSLPYALWKAEIIPAVIPGNPFDGDLFTHTPHVAEARAVQEASHGLV